ncbi:hypothetical protein, partial [Sulfitobacter geojensis]|uniref:hypothetical protein n=1 Tax=Sulfitobacter geojensis TaxID=1342299 RepID=UPI001EED9A49
CNNLCNSIKNLIHHHGQPDYPCFVPRSVNSTSDPCCPLHEWLVFLQCGSTDLYADAAFSKLRAHAARKPNSHKGLIASVNCGLREQQL